MALGEITKQFAKQAIVDALRPPDLSKISESLPGEKAAAPVQAENTGAVIVAQLHAMQKVLKDDEELLVLCSAGLEMLRVLEIYMPSWRVAVLTGIDTEKTVTRVVSPVDALQLVAKPVKVQTGSKATRLRFITPK